MPQAKPGSAIIFRMILVTGGTGFIGSRFVEKLLKLREDVRILLRPSKISPDIPKNISLDVAVSSLNDEKGLRSAMQGVTSIYHFASAENSGPDPDFEGVDVGGTENLILSAKTAKVKKILFLSRVGSDKTSSYPVLRAKAIAENEIHESGLAFNILRLTDVYGKNDHFSENFAAGIRYAPILMPIPAGETVLQPLWVEDLISILVLIHEQEKFPNKIYEIGGGEFFTLPDTLKLISRIIGKKRILLPTAPAYLRLYNLWFKQYRSAFPLSTKWLDLLAIDRTCPLDSMPRNFEILPARFSYHLDYLESA